MAGLFSKMTYYLGTVHYEFPWQHSSCCWIRHGIWQWLFCEKYKKYLFFLLPWLQWCWCHNEACLRLDYLLLGVIVAVTGRAACTERRRGLVELLDHPRQGRHVLSLSRITSAKYSSLYCQFVTFLGGGGGIFSWVQFTVRESEFESGNDISLSTEWNSIRPGGPSHKIVTKTVHTTLLDSFFSV